ncbi:hypothetical protein [Nostoc commune]|nr:hypothetical protein [Nostoc commune]
MLPYVVFGGTNLGSGGTPGNLTGTPGADTFFGTPSCSELQT